MWARGPSFRQPTSDPLDHAAAKHYQFKARVGKEIHARLQGLSEAIHAIAWKGQLRLTSRYAALHASGVRANKVCVAVARELAGFVWAIGMYAQRKTGIT